jgi:hypothetical protein
MMLVLVMLNGCSTPSSQPVASAIPSPATLEPAAPSPQDTLPKSPYVLTQDRLVAAMQSVDSEIRRAALEEVVADAALRDASVARSRSVQLQITELMSRDEDLFKSQNVIEGPTWMVENRAAPELRDAVRGLLTKGVRGEEDGFRSAAVRALSRIGMVTDIRVLKEVAQKSDLDATVRSQMQNAILKMEFRQQHDALLDLLVWGLHVRTDSTKYPDNLDAEVRDYIRRAEVYEPQPPPNPLPFPEWQMVSTARIAYERKLAGLSDHPDAARLAMEYVRDLTPCYEWEGFHDCPEREAEFADKYFTVHPVGPFRSYLPLLAAHRWLCAAEAFDYEGKPEDSKRSLELFEVRASVARTSSDALIRAAADRLAERRSCFAPGTLRP